MKTELLILLGTPILTILFAYTKANIYSFWFGFLLCVLSELSICFVYVFVKLHKTHRDSQLIKLQNPTLTFESEYPMPKLQIAKDIYLNIFTEQARLTNKKQSVQQPQLQSDIQQINFDKVRYKQRIEKYLEQIRNQYNCLSYFTQGLVDFGNRMKLVGEKSLIFYGTAYQFAKHQACFVNQHFYSELQQEEKKALFKELKIALKKPKTKNEKLGNQSIQIKGVQELQNIVLPTWNSILFAMSKVGDQFKQLQGMKEANTVYLEMVHKKILQDYEIIEKQITASISTIWKIKANLEDLRRQHQKLQKYETTSQGNDNIEIIYWLKKQYFQFTNLAMRIKRQQISYKEHEQQITYYKAKLASFYQKQKAKYEETIQTRSIAFLDAYRITLEESLKYLKDAFDEDGYQYAPEVGPPKVKELAKSKNIDEIIANQQTYQEQYFERVDFYIKKITMFQNDIEQMDIFMSKVRSIFTQFKMNLILDPRYTQLDSQRQRKALIFDSLMKQLGQQMARIFRVLANLESINKQFMEMNKRPLLQTKQRISQFCNKARSITTQISRASGPLKQRYKIAKHELNIYYNEIQQNINGIKQFQKLFQLHSNRIKKILVVSFTFFIANQKKLVMSYINSDTSLRKRLNQSDIDDQNNEEEPTKQDKPAQPLDINLQNVNHLETGVLFCQEYRQLLNRFFFVAYTEWSKSHVFRQLISEEIYIALNQDIDQNFSQIIVEDFQASGLPPEINWIKQLKSEQGQFIIDFNLSFRGKLVIKISTKINFVTSFQVQFELAIQDFFATIRLCFVHHQLGRSWISFVGEPQVKITPRPKIGNVSINMKSVADLMQKFVLDKMKQLIYPIKKKLMIPLYRKDEAFDIIKKRFESMAV